MFCQFIFAGNDDDRRSNILISAAAAALDMGFVLGFEWPRFKKQKLFGLRYSQYHHQRQGVAESEGDDDATPRIPEKWDATLRQHSDANETLASMFLPVGCRTS